MGNLIDELLASLQGRVLNPDLGVDLAVNLAQLGYGYLAGGPARAAGIYAQTDSRPDEAYARLQAARQFFTSGQPEQATAVLDLALGFYREVRREHPMASWRRLEALTSDRNRNGRLQASDGLLSGADRWPPTHRSTRCA